MHELSLTSDLVEAIVERVETLGSPRIKRVLLEIGADAAVMPQAIQFCFDVCAQGTPVEGASLEVVETPGEALRLLEVEID